MNSIEIKTFKDENGRIRFFIKIRFQWNSAMEFRFLGNLKIR